MTDQEMIEAIQTLVDNSRFDDFAEHYLAVAQEAVVSRIYPLDDSASWSDVPEKFHNRTVEIAVYLVNRRGAEGEVSHSESGTSRTYESAGIPKSYFVGMTPHVGVPS